MDRRSSNVAFAAAALLILRVSSTVEAQFVRGDIDGNGLINLTDGNVFLNYYVAAGSLPAGGSLEAIDANDDNARSFADYLYLQNFLFFGGPPIPPPNGVPGLDPTPGGPPAPRVCLSFQVQDTPGNVGGMVTVPVLLKYLPLVPPTAFAPTPPPATAYTVGFLFDPAYLMLTSVLVGPSVAALSPTVSAPTLGAPGSGEGRLVVAIDVAPPFMGLAPGEDIVVAQLVFSVSAVPAGQPFHTLITLSDAPFSVSAPGAADRSLRNEVVLGGNGVMLRPELIPGRVLINNGPYVRGDIDGNGTLQTTDFVVLLNSLFIMGTPPFNPAPADFNNNGLISFLDPNCIARHLFQGGAPPPPPFPVAGPAPLVAVPPPSPANTLSIQSGSVWSAVPNTIPVVLTHAAPCEAFIVSMQYDPAVLNVSSASLAAGLPMSVPPGTAVNVDPVAGRILAHAFFAAPIPPGVTSILDITAMPVSFPPGEYTHICFRDAAIPDWRYNEIVTDLLNCVSLRPTLVSANVGPSLQFIRGDCNRDAQKDISDPILMLNCLFQGSNNCDPCLDACDSNDDGGFDISDAVCLLTFCFLGTCPTPPPNPGCGCDPTPDPLELCWLTSPGCP